MQGERRGRTSVPTARARFVRYSWLPAESRQTAAADMGSSTTRGESGAAEHLCPLPTHGLSPPQYRQPATEIRRPAVAGYLRQHNTGRATQHNVCTHYGLPDIVGRPPKSAGLLPPDIGGRTTRGGERRSRASMPVARAQLAQYNRPTIGWFVPPCSNPIAAVLAS